ncbi:MAG: hypothetical protein WBI17_11365 [Clostridiaceae bacterium]
MDEKRIRIEEKTENILGGISWILLAVVILCVVFTTLNRNDVYKIRYFNNYLTLEISIFMGLLVWGFRFLLNSKKYPGYRKYSIYAFVFAFIQLIFMLSNVY